MHLITKNARTNNTVSYFLKLSVFRVVNQVTIYILTTALQLDTIIRKHVGVHP